MKSMDKLLDDIDIEHLSDIHITSDLSPVVRIDGKLVKAYKKMILKLKNLSNAPTLKAFTELKDGLVLFTGPTGAGKSTTLAAMVN